MGKTNTFYFSHNCDTRQDDKIQELIFEMGYTGYGLYWAIVEMLYLNEGYMQTHCERIAYALNTDKESIVKVINNYDLFLIDGNTFTSNGVLKRLEERSIKSQKAKESAEARWNNANALQTESERNAIKGEEKILKEKKVNKSKEEKEPLPGSDLLLKSKEIYRKIWKYFPESTRPEENKDSDTEKTRAEKEKKHDSWIDEIRKLIELDGHPDEEIIKVIKWARESEFWGKKGVFLSVLKLRQKDKNKIKFYEVFKIQMHGNQKNNSIKKTREIRPVGKSDTGKWAKSFNANDL